MGLAIYLFVEAILDFGLWFQVRTSPGRERLLFDGTVTLVGISMLFSGVSRFVLSLAVRRLAE